MSENLIHALAWAAQEAPPAGQPPAGGFSSMFLMFGMIAVLFWVLILRPQKREQAKRDEMLNQLGKGDQVVTTGGIMGTIESVDGEKGVVTVNVAPKTSLKFSRQAVATVTQKGKPATEAEGDKTQKK